MITIFSHFILFLFIMYLNGFFFLKKILRIKDLGNFYEISLIGLIITLFFSQFLNFFIPINDFVLLLNIIFLIVFIIFNKKIILKYFNLDYKIFTTLIILALINIYGSGYSDDLNHYHYSFITNSDELNLIWGYSYLHPLYGTMPLWLVGHSYFNFDYSRLQDIHVLNGIILFLVSALLLDELKKKRLKNFFFNPLLFAILIFIFFKYTRLKEFGIDRPAILLFCFLIFYYFKYFLNNQNFTINNFLILVFISFSIFFVKIIYIPALILPVVVFLSNKNFLFKFHLKYLFIFLIVFIYMTKNILASGCIIYPLDISCINFLKWTDTARIAEISLSQEIVNKSWSSYSGNYDEQTFIKNFNWFNDWFNRGKIEIIELFTITLIFIIISLHTFGFSFRNFKKNNVVLKNLNIFLILLMAFSLFLFFLKNPVIRMNHHFLLSLMLLIISLVCNFNLNKVKNNFLISVLVLGLFFNISKNILRIHENNFINNPKKQILEKIWDPYVFQLNDFTYYQGWFGKAPIGNQQLNNRKHQRKFIFDIIY